jgi:hypothetical protein
MKVEEDELTVQVENRVDFISLTHHKCDLTSYLKHQHMNGYFNMLNGPTYENLVKYLWVWTEIYDKFAAKLEEHEKVLIDPSLEGKTREEMGLKPFTRTEIRTNIMGIPVTINKEIMGRACKRNVEGSFQENLNSKTSTWKTTVRDSLFNGNSKGKYKDI